MTEQEVMAPADVPVAVAVSRLEREGRPGAVDTGRYLLRYALWGEGPPIIIVHGISDMARSFALVGAELSKHFTCVLYELPTGAGDGARLGAYRHEHFAADLFALMDHLNLDRTYILGSSFGSTIALRAAAEHPQRFARMVLQGGFARRKVSTRDRILSQFARYFPGRMGQLRLRTGLKNDPENKSLDPAQAEKRAFMRANCLETPIAAVARFALIIAKLDLRPLLPKVRVPVRLIGGDRDGIVPAIYEQELLAGLPSAERLEIADCGHVPQYTHPGLLAELTRQFFTPECGRVPHDGCEHH